MSTASLLRDVQQSQAVGPVTRAIANWDGAITKEALERVHELKVADLGHSRASGEGRFRGSLLGACPRMQMMSFLGYLGTEPEEAGLDLMRDGTYRHYLWQEVGLSSGFLQQIETKAWYEPFLFGGQLDGLMAPDEVLPGNGGFELKTTKWDYYKQVRDYLETCKKLSIHPLQNVTTVPILLKWVNQMGGYAKALSLDWFSLVVEVRGSRIEWFELVLEHDERHKAIYEASFKMLHGYKDREELPPMKPDYPKDKECAYWCGFKKLCPNARY